ncbi:hypothetical protein V8C86DRAFT_3035128 [Haematococcus lacustris]
MLSKTGVWKELRDIVDGHDITSYAAGEVQHTTKRAKLITTEMWEAAKPFMDPRFPKGLVTRVLVNFGYLTLMRCADMQGILVGHLDFLLDSETGRTTVRISELSCKNNQGGTKDAKRDPIPKYLHDADPSLLTGDVYADAEVCPVAALRLLVDKLPMEPATETTKQRRWTGHLFLQATRATDTDSPWFTRQNLGKTSVAEYIAEAIGTTSHALKRTSTTELVKSGKAPTLIQQLGGWEVPQ